MPPRTPAGLGASSVKPNPHAFGVDEIAVGFLGVDEESCSKPGSFQPSATGELPANPEDSARRMIRDGTARLRNHRFRLRDECNLGSVLGLTRREPKPMIGNRGLGPEANSVASVLHLLGHKRDQGRVARVKASPGVPPFLLQLNDG